MSEQAKKDNNHQYRLGLSAITTFACIFVCGSSILSYIYFKDAIQNEQFLKNNENVYDL